MNIEQAILILKDYINVDRQVRNYQTKSDFDNYCETNCIAIETLINEIEKRK